MAEQSLKEQAQAIREQQKADREAENDEAKAQKEAEKAEKEAAKEAEKANKEAAQSVAELVKEDGIDALPPNFEYAMKGEYVRARVTEDGGSYIVVQPDGTTEVVDGEEFSTDYEPVTEDQARAYWTAHAPAEEEEKSKKK